MTFQVPEHLVRRFQAVSFERLDAIDSAWTTLSRGAGTPDLEAQLHRDLHTLKGDARVLAFTDVALLCEKLEDLLGAARRRHYRVGEEGDIIVTMGIQFIGVLLRKRGGAVRGIDLEGFLKQIEDVLQTWDRVSEPPQSAPASAHLSSGALGAASPITAPRRLAMDATWVYVEHLSATRETSRRRLLDVWSSLAHEIERLETADLAPILEAHAEAGRELARDLGKELDVVCKLPGELTLDADLAEALNVAVLHGVRNAIDHGIEPADVRLAGGKPRRGAVTLEVVKTKTHLLVRVIDDGGGIDVVAARRRATEMGLLPASDGVSDDAVLELLFTQGLSTRTEVTDVSGRGVGLDAAREAMTTHGGSATVRTRSGAGTTLEIRAPVAQRHIEVHTFRAARSGAWMAVEEGWSASEHPPDGTEVDVDAVLDLVATTPLDGSRALAFTRDGATVRLLAASDAMRRETAARICRTPDGSPFEVIALENGHAILVRPHLLP